MHINLKETQNNRATIKNNIGQTEINTVDKA